MLRLAVGLFFIALPVLELALLIKTGQKIGLLATSLLVIGAAVAGGAIISRQSFTVVRQTLDALSEGRPPVAGVIDGLFLMLAGFLLAIPGLISDVLAFVLLVPPVRRAFARWSMRQALGLRDADEDRAYGTENAGRRAGASTGGGPVIEGEFERLSETPPQTGPADQRHPR